MDALEIDKKNTRGRLKSSTTGCNKIIFNQAKITSSKKGSKNHNENFL